MVAVWLEEEAGHQGACECPRGCNRAVNDGVGVWRLGLRTIHTTAARDCRFVPWLWHSRLLLGREDLLARHRVPMRWRARLAFLTDVLGVPSC